MLQSDLFEHFPKKPYCADAKDAVRIIRARASALKRAYIQPNHPALLHWLVYDIDRPQAALAWEDANLPPPTFTVARRDRSDSAHLWYGLHIPVKMADPADTTKAMHYAAAIELGMSRQMKADPAFTGQLAKTPSHEAWRTFRGPGLYDLDTLADYVIKLPDLRTKGREQTELIRLGIGRNVELFDTLRHWAYRHARDFTSSSFENWQKALNAQGHLLNTTLFSNPLEGMEVAHTSKSIAKWVWDQQRKREAQFISTQRHRSKLAAKARTEFRITLLEDLKKSLETP